MLHIAFNSCVRRYEAFTVGCGGSKNYLKDSNGSLRRFKSQDFAEGWAEASGYQIVID